ncbi:MAG: chloride channel protein, partial [Spirochaetes bacterium]|nr:chloride channel protein [Spirochaetota bacterium]
MNKTKFKNLFFNKMTRLLVYSILIGIVAGLVAAAFFFSLQYCKHITFHSLAGYAAPPTAGEKLFESGSPGLFRQWIFFILPVVGGLLSGIIVYFFAPEAEGHGTDAMIDAFHNKQGIIRPRVPFIKAIATIITLSTGGSAGREGPIAQIGAGLGSTLANILKLSSRERRIFLLAGCGAGLSAIFRAPLGGALT